ncbi:glycosyltransferase family 4 protein [Gordonia alkanivorans]|uniref:glycosyltransferase family 4 protein n=1 Tax=Gordonia alkanivorans TaxID=84096 RepID=UPI00244B8B33|nr:glycosyltransferase family 4 protein [Gordonia alkanivorans]MDH3026958.1 glycosyltransferase family 4 protein [Gordonia alkanivorans]
MVQNLPVPFDRRVWQEALALRDVVASVTVISPADDKFPAGQFEIDGVNVRRYSAPPEGVGIAGYLREYFVSLRAIRREVKVVSKIRSIQIVHICNPPDFLFLAVRRLTRRGAALIFDQHDLGPELIDAKQMKFGAFFRLATRLMEALTYRSADHVISTNNSYRTIAITRGRFPSSQVTVVRSGPSSSWIKEGEVDPAWRRGRRHLIGYVGVMGRQDGLEYLLRATKCLIRDGLDVELALAGSGPDLARLKQLASELGVVDHVQFLGRVSDEDLRSVLASADVCVNPDEVNKMNDLSTMNKILEYMAMGRPIVQFDVMEGRYSAGSSARYAAPNDVESLASEIRWVLEHPMEAKEMGSEGKRRFQQELCWEQQVPKLRAAYASVLRAHDAEASQ